MSTSRPIRRSRRDRIIAGVCGGLAEWLEWKPTLVRVLFVVGSLIPVLPGFVVYLVLWIGLPQEEPGDQPGNHHRLP